MLTKKYYKAIAQILFKHFNAYDVSFNCCSSQIKEVEHIADEIADFFAGDNPNFDRQKWDMAIFGPS